MISGFDFHSPSAFSDGFRRVDLHFRHNTATGRQHLFRVTSDRKNSRRSLYCRHERSAAGGVLLRIMPRPRNARYFILRRFAATIVYSHFDDNDYCALACSEEIFDLTSYRSQAAASICFDARAATKASSRIDGRRSHRARAHCGVVGRRSAHDA